MLKKIAVGLLSLAGLSYLLIPSPKLPQALGTTGELLQRYLAIEVLVLILGAMVCALLSTLRPNSTQRNTAPNTPTPTSKAGPKKIQLALQIGLSALLLFQTVSNLDRPFDIDETGHNARLANGEYVREFTLFKHSNHQIAQGLSLVSMQLFGFHKDAARYPSVGITFLLLVALNLFLLRWASLFVACFVLGHLAANQCFAWYSFSSRGYILTALVSFLLFAIPYQWARGRHLEKRHFMAFLGLLLAAPFTHLFAGIFGSLLWLGILVWLSVHQQALSPTQYQQGRSLLKWGAVALPLIVLVAALHGMSLHSIGDFHPEKQHASIPWALPVLFSLTHAGSLRAATLLVVVLLVWEIADRRSAPSRLFEPTFLVLAGVTLTAILWALDVRLLFPRFLIGFLIPMLLWLGNAIEYRLRSHWLRLPTMGFVLLVFSLGAAQMSNAGLENHLRPFETFAMAVRDKAPLVTRPCFSYEYYGKTDFEMNQYRAYRSALEKFYLREATHTPSQRCSDHWLIAYVGTEEEAEARFAQLEQAHALPAALHSPESGLVLYNVKTSAK